MDSLTSFCCVCGYERERSCGTALTVVAVEVVVLARHCALTEVLVNIESHALEGNERRMGW